MSREESEPALPLAVSIAVAAIAVAIPNTTGAYVQLAKPLAEPVLPVYVTTAIARGVPLGETDLILAGVHCADDIVAGWMLVDAVVNGRGHLLDALLRDSHHGKVSLNFIAFLGHDRSRTIFPVGVLLLAAIDAGAEGIVHALLEDDHHGTITPRVLFRAAMGANPKILSMIAVTLHNTTTVFQRGQRTWKELVNAQDQHRMTPLHRAASKRGMLTQEFIALYKGATETLDKFGNTAHDYAVMTGDEVGQRILQANGASPPRRRAVHLGGFLCRWRAHRKGPDGSALCIR